MWPELRRRVDRQVEAATLREVNLRGHFRHQPDEPCGRLRDVVFPPTAIEEEEHDLSPIQSVPLVRPRSETKVSSQHRPATLAIKSLDPLGIRGSGVEVIPESENLMLTRE